MKKLLEEFKAFVMRGNVVDMAVGVIIATAFGKIVTSLVNDIFMPIIGVLIGNMDFFRLTNKIRNSCGGVEQAAIRYGAFIQEVINFFYNCTLYICFYKSCNFFTKEKRRSTCSCSWTNKRRSFTYWNQRCFK